MSNDASDLARRLIAIGVSRPYASQLARGLRTPSLALAQRIERSLGIPASSWVPARETAA